MQGRRESAKVRAPASPYCRTAYSLTGSNYSGSSLPFVSGPIHTMHMPIT